MKIVRIAITKSRTVNLGDYESKKAELTMEAEVDDPVKVIHAIHSLDEVVNSELVSLLSTLR